MDVYLRNVGRASQIHTVQIPKKRIDLNNETWAKPKISKGKFVPVFN
jgi:hypothetical protein